MTNPYHVYGTDKKKTSDGVWFSYDGGLELKLAHSGSSNVSYMETFRREFGDITKKRKQRNLSEEQTTKKLAKVFAETIVMGWRIKVGDKYDDKVPDKDGNPMKFNKANVQKLLSDLSPLFDEVIQDSGDFSSYREEEIEEAAKNS